MAGSGRAVLVAVLVVLAVAAEMGPLVVETANGGVRGRRASELFESRGRVFQAIPYAQPPVGELRFQPPQPLTHKWTGVRDATKPRHVCWQHGNISGSSKSEDCLTLDVYVPYSAKEGDELPVMVWLYGGSWKYGSTQVPIYDGSFIIDDHKNVVVVTLNYRLGAFGWLGGELMRQHRADNTSGNMGLMDQQMAMRWVQQNIRAFGGDPGNVMLFGESAGAGSTSCHLVLPSSQGLYQRAAMESGPLAHWTSRPLSFAEKALGKVLVDARCANASDPYACLLAVAPEDMIHLGAKEANYYTEWSPVVDGVFLPENPNTLAMQGKMFSGPVLLGTNRNEGYSFSGNVSKTLNATQYSDLVYARWGAAAHPLLMKHYPLSAFGNSFEAIAAMVTDMFMACPARRTARWVDAAGGAAFLYQFNHLVDEVALVKPDAGVFHGSELFFVWDLSDGFYSVETIPVPVPIFLTPAENLLQRQMVTYWTSFATTGNPNSPDAEVIHWPQYNATSDLNMDLNLGLSVVQHLKKVRCDMWDSIFVPVHE